MDNECEHEFESRYYQYALLGGSQETPRWGLTPICTRCNKTIVLSEGAMASLRIRGNNGSRGLLGSDDL